MMHQYRPPCIHGWQSNVRRLLAISWVQLYDSGILAEANTVLCFCSKPCLHVNTCMHFTTQLFVISLHDAQIMEINLIRILHSTSILATQFSCSYTMNLTSLNREYHKLPCTYMQVIAFFYGLGEAKWSLIVRCSFEWWERRIRIRNQISSDEWNKKSQTC